MIFHRITIENLFSYYGQHSLDFSTGADKLNPVCLILGRNGFGKTSFLNSIKLLFLGSEDKSQRRVGFPPSHLPRHAYVLGKGGSWEGILNRDARAEERDQCSICAELGDSNGNRIIAKRIWTFRENSFEENLEVSVGDRPLAGASAEAKLDELLPRELVPFFLFDGEEIQQLAEASDIKRAEAMERLLSLSFINGVESELSSLAKDWRRENFPEDVQAQIKEAEGKRESLSTRIDGAEKKCQDLADQESEYDAKCKDCSHQMNMLRSNSILGSADSITQQINELKPQLESKHHDLAYDLATDAPLIANSSLLSTALEQLKEAVDQKSKASQSIEKTLFKVLPKRLLEEPPQPREQLSTDQVAFLTKKLTSILETYAISDKEAKPIFDGLDYARARTLLDTILGISSSSSELRSSRARRLKEISADNIKLAKLQTEHREAQFGSTDVAEQYGQLEKEHSEFQRELGRIQNERSHTTSQLDDFKSQRDEIDRTIKSLEKDYSIAGKAHRRVGIAERLRKSFLEYRKTRREAKRHEIEKAINSHFQALMTGHDLIAHIQISEDFHLNFVDKDGRSLGSSTISHGMRQLAVTSLLWALKDVSQKELPIVVDTPLARIDRENQDNLLNAYYPAAAEQVIILATDSEIDERKFELLRPNLSRVFKLSNPEGSRTSVEGLNLGEKPKLKWQDVANG